MSACLSQAMRRDFALYREHMEVARDPDERDAARRKARSRAELARKRLEQKIARIEAAGL